MRGTLDPGILHPLTTSGCFEKKKTIVNNANGGKCPNEIYFFFFVPLVEKVLIASHFLSVLLRDWFIKNKLFVARAVEWFATVWKTTPRSKRSWERLDGGVGEPTETGDYQPAPGNTTSTHKTVEISICADLVG